MNATTATTMMTKKEVRAILRSAFGARKYRIVGGGEIHVYGRMPNTSVIGWYLYGDLSSAYTQAMLEDIRK